MVCIELKKILIDLRTKDLFSRANISLPIGGLIFLFYIQNNKVFFIVYI